MQSNKQSSYRIKPLSKKLEDSRDDPHKISVHSGSNFNKSHSGSKRQTQSNLDYSRKRELLLKKTMSKIRQRIRPQSCKKKPEKRQIMQFDNVKWISIISAYDPNRLKFVTTTNQSCSKFLKTHGPTLKKDMMGNISFRDLIKNFKSWIGKIDQKYFYIMDNFLNNKKGVNSTLQKLKPLIDQVLGETEMMQQKIQHCLKTYENIQFRKLLQKFHNYLQASKEIQKVIIIVSKSKSKIEELFKNFEKDLKLDVRVNKVRQKGINQARQVVFGHNQTGLQEKIMEKVESAINQMAQKSLQAYSKIKGVKQLMLRLKNVIDQNKNFTDLKHIILMNEIFKEVFNQANSFDKFSQKFLQQGDVANEDLISVIKKYQQQVNSKKKVVNELQLNFLHHILSEMINKLKLNNQVSRVLDDPNHHQEYVLANKVISQISQCFLDQQKHFLLQKIVKDTKYNLIRLDDQLQKLRKINSLEEIDTQQGLITILQIGKLMKQYKDRIRSIRKKYEQCHRNLHLLPLKVDQVVQDQQLVFINDLTEVSQKINGHDLKERIQIQVCFSSPFKYGLTELSIQSQKTKIIIQIKELTLRIRKLQKTNIFEKNFGPLNITHLILTEADQMIKMKEISDQTKQKNLLPQLNSLIQQRKNWIQENNKCSKHFQHYYERLLARILVKSLKETDIKEIDCKAKLVFPTTNEQIQSLKNQIKYKGVILSQIQNSFLTHSKMINANQHQILHDHKHKKHHSHVVNLLKNNINAVQKFIWAHQTIKQISKNQNNSIFISKEDIINFCEDLFHSIFISNKGQQTKKIQKLVQGFLKIGTQKVLGLSRKIFEFQSLQKNKKLQENINDQSVNTVSPEEYILKITEKIEEYRKYTQILIEKLREQFNQFKAITKKNNNSNSQEKNNVQYISLKIYSSCILNLTRYLKQTKQVVYVLLNKQKCPLGILDIKNATQSDNLKVLIKGLKKGERLKQCIWKPIQIGFQLKKQDKQQNIFDKAVKSKKKKPQLQEQIQQQSLQKPQQIYDQNFEVQDQIANEQIANEMEEEYQNDQMQQIEDIQMQQNLEVQEQDLKQQINSNIQQIEQNNQIQQEKIEDLEEMLEEYDEEISKSHANKRNNKNIKKKSQINQFQQWQKEEKSNNQKNKQQQQKIEQDKIKQEKIKQQQQQKEKSKKIQEKSKKIQEKKEYVKLMKSGFPISVDATIYECLSIVTTLHDLKNILNHIFSFGQIFFNQLDFKKIADFFNKISDQPTDAYLKSLDKLIDKEIQKTFSKDLSKQILNLHSIKQIKKNILLLQNGNSKALEQILQRYQISYNLIKNTKKQTIFIHIQDPNSTSESAKSANLQSVHQMLSKRFKNYSVKTFNLIEYVSNCFGMTKISYKNTTKVQYFNGVVQYIVNDDSSLPNQKTDEIYKTMLNTIQNFSFNKPKDHINKFDLCINLWLKVLLCVDKIELDLIQFQHSSKNLKEGSSQTSVLYYIDDVNEKCKEAKKTIKRIKSKLENIIFKCTQDNIFDCIRELKTIYGESISKVILHNQREMIIFDQTFQDTNIQLIKTRLENIDSSKKLEDQDIILSLLFDQVSVNSKENQNIDSKEMIIRCQNVNNAVFSSNKLQNNKILEKQTMFFSVLQINHYFICYPSFIMTLTLQDCIVQFTEQLLVSFKKQAIKSQLAQNHPFLKRLNQIKKIEQLNSQFLQLFKYPSNHASNLSNQITVDESIFVLNNSVKQFLMFAELQDKHWKLMSQMKKTFNKDQNNLCLYIYNKYLPTSQEFSRFNQKIKKINQKMISLQGLIQICKGNKSWFMFFDTPKLNFINNYKNQTKFYLQRVQKILDKAQSVGFQELGQQIQASYIFIKKLYQNEKIDLTKCEVQTQQNIHIIFYQLNSKSIKLKEIIDLIYPKSQQSVIFLTKIIEQNLIQVQNDHDENAQTNNNGLKEHVCTLDWTSLLTQIKDYISSQGLDQICVRIEEEIRVFINQFNLIYFAVNSKGDSNNEQSLKKLYLAEDQIKNSFNQINRIQKLKTISNQFKFILKNQKIMQIFNMLQDSVKVNCFTQVVIQNILKMFTKLNLKTLKPNQFNYKIFSQFFMYVIDKILKLPFYTVLSSKASKNKIITFILPQNQKLRESKSEQTQKFLTKTMQSLNLPLKFTIKQNKNVKILQLQQEVIQVCLDHTILDKKSIQYMYNNNFGLEGEQAVQKWYYAIYQNYQGKLNLLAVHDLSLFQQDINIMLDFSHLRASISCFVVQMHPSNKSQTDMIKKAGNLSGKSPQEKIQNVRVGERITFKKTSQWLMKAIQKIQKHVQQKGKQEQQQIKLFLGKIYKELEVSNLQSFSIPFSQFQKQIKDGNIKDDQYSNDDQIENKAQLLKPRSKKVIRQAQNVFKKVSSTISVQQNKFGQKILQSYIDKINQKISKREKIQNSIVEIVDKQYSRLEQIIKKKHAAPLQVNNQNGQNEQIKQASIIQQGQNKQLMELLSKTADDLTDEQFKSQIKTMIFKSLDSLGSQSSLSIQNTSVKIRLEYQKEIKCLIKVFEIQKKLINKYKTMLLQKLLELKEEQMKVVFWKYDEVFAFKN